MHKTKQRLLALEARLAQVEHALGGLRTMIADLQDPDATRAYPSPDGVMPVKEIQRSPRTAQPGGITTRGVFIPVERIRGIDRLRQLNAAVYTWEVLDGQLGFDIIKTHGNVSHELLVKSRHQWEHMQPTERVHS